MNLLRISIALLCACSIPAAAEAQNFSGPSAGVEVGWEHQKISNPSTDLGVVAIDDSRDSADLGAYVGYDRQFGRIVLGAEAGIEVAMNDDLAGTTAVSAATIDPKRSAELTARAGFLVDPATLVYVRGGYTNERVRTTLASAAGSASASEDRDGWLIGAGVERMVLPKVSARLEYRYADLSQGDGRFDRHQVLGGVTFHF